MGEELFSQRLKKPLSVNTFSTYFVVFSIVANDNTLWLVRHPAQNKTGPELHQLHSQLSIHGNNTQM